MNRYCTNCGAMLPEDARFCGSCGRPAHETAAVATPEADVAVPQPPPPAARPSSPTGRGVRGSGPSIGAGPVVVIAACFLIAAASGGWGAASSSAPSDGAGTAIVLAIFVGLIVGMVFAVPVVLVAGLYWLVARNDGVAFLRALFNWPVALLAAVIAIVFSVPW